MSKDIPNNIKIDVVIKHIYEDVLERTDWEEETRQERIQTAKWLEEFKEYKKIQSTVNEFWEGLQKLSMFKGKEKPTLEELLEYIEQKDKEIWRLQKDKADIISAVEYRINQAKEFAYKELAKKLKDRVVSRCEYTDIRVFNELDNLLAELTPSNFTKVDHSSLCETETYEGNL